jgi:TPR repeat protein
MTRARSVFLSLCLLLFGASLAQAAGKCSHQSANTPQSLANSGAAVQGAKSTVPAVQSFDVVYKRALGLWQGRDGDGDREETIAMLQQAAEEGHASSQNLLGRIFDEGRLVRRNPAVALKWYERAAAQALPAAQLNAGLMHRTGDGVPRDAAKARQFFERAADNRSIHAQYVLAVMLEDGEGGPADAERAVHWYRLAAEANYGPAQHNLAVAYATGSGVPRSERAAVNWYRAAAHNGQAKSQFLLGKAFAESVGAPYDAGQAYVWFTVAAANAGRDETLRRQAHDHAARISRELTPEQLAKAKREIAAKLTSRG